MLLASTSQMIEVYVVDGIWYIWISPDISPRSISDGGGVRILGLSCMCNWIQSSGDNLFRSRPPHAAPVLSFRQELIQLTTRPPDLSSADLFRGINSNGFWPVIITSKRYTQDKPYMTALFILVPATWMTWRMQPVPIYTSISLSTNTLSFQEL